MDVRSRFFSVEDYVVFATMLCVSLGIGIFFAVKQWKSRASAEEYLLASRSVSFFPVAMSLAASYSSAVVIIGVPADVYKFGTLIWWFPATTIIVTIIVSDIYIPIFCNLGITSAYEYLELRFTRSARIIANFFFTIESLLYLAINIYGPSIALSTVTGFDLSTAMLTTGLVCTLYTAAGGLKAVIWTDVVQLTVMFAGQIAVVIRGSVLVGGYQNVWNINKEGGRIELINFDTDPRIRHTFWTLFVGGTIFWTSVFGVSQPQVQRYICSKNQKHAKIALLLASVQMLIIGSLSVMCGTIMYAYYSGCDPLTQKCVSASDQLLPYLVMDIFQDYPGVPGLFVSAVFSGSLSTISSGINSMATIAMEDFIKPYTKWSDWKFTLLSKVVVVLYGVLCLGLAYIISILGDLVQVAISVLSLIGGPLLGIFTLGILFPFVNSAGAISGFFFGLLVNVWWFVARKLNTKPVEFIRPLLLDTSSCDMTCGSSELNQSLSLRREFSSNITIDNMENYSNLENFYWLSYSYTSAIGLFATLGCGIAISLATCGWAKRKEVDRRLLLLVGNYWMFSFLPPKLKIFFSYGIDLQKPANGNTANTANDLEEPERRTSISEETQ